MYQANPSEYELFSNVTPENSEYLLVKTTGLGLSQKYGTMFTYPQVHIEQVLLPVQVDKADVAVPGQLQKAETADEIAIKGLDANYSVTFSKKTGEMTSLKYDGQEMLIAGLQPNFWRGITDNDVANGTQVRCGTWREAASKMVLKGIEDLTPSDKDKATVVATFDMP